ncbi:MAG: AbrB family transcriptional regulator [Gammaproteobacteria bacterium]|nr:AbrB family transcriptional regulator [Gammaproteobacteria bacterium]
MRIKLVKVGNSKGIIIPAALLASCELKESVDLQIEGKKLVIAAIQEPRAGWFDGYHAGADEAMLDAIPINEGDDEWVW